MGVLKRCTFAVVVAVVIGTARTPAIAGDEQASTAEILASLADHPVPAGPEALYFHYLLYGRGVGYAVHTLTPRGDGGKEGFEYRVEAVLQLPQAAHLATTVVARLTASFEPVEIETIRDITAPDGTQQRSRITAFITDDALTIERQTDDGAIEANTAAVPERPYVAAVEFLVQRIDLRRFPKFELREFDPQNGDVILQRFRLKPLAGKDMELRSTRRNGSIDYQFTLDNSGRMMAMKRAPLPLVAGRTSREQCERLRRRFSGM